MKDKISIFEFRNFQVFCNAGKIDFDTLAFSPLLVIILAYCTHGNFSADFTLSDKRFLCFPQPLIIYHIFFN